MDDARRAPLSVLAINGGSPSIRFALYRADEPLRWVLDGKVDRIGLSGTSLSAKDSAGKELEGRAIETDPWARSSPWVNAEARSPPALTSYVARAFSRYWFDLATRPIVPNSQPASSPS